MQARRMLPRVRAGLTSRSLGTRAGSRPLTAADYLALEDKYNAHNYHPLPVVLSKGEGVFLFDVEGRKYYDCLSAYSAVNQGHCHPRLLKTLTEQSSRLTLTSRAFFNDQLGPYAEFMCKTFGFDRILPMNSGVEACETAFKLARKWAYEVKGVPKDQAVVAVAHGCFWGRSMAAISSSDDPDSYGNFGPLLGGIRKVEYGDIESLRSLLEAEGSRMAAYMVEPIQGEAGVRVPPAGYLRQARDLCRKHNVLFIADEVQTGLGRTGKLLACDHESVKPDILVLGKALSGGLMPVSAVLSSDEVMLTIRPGQHGSTYGGSPLACAVARESVSVLLDEKMPENAMERGQQFRAGLSAVATRHPGVVSAVRGKGLLNAVVMNPTAVDTKGRPISAWDVCLALKDAAAVMGASVGLLAKPTQTHVIRLAPPLTLNSNQTDQCVELIGAAIEGLASGNDRFRVKESASH